MVSFKRIQSLPLVSLFLFFLICAHSVQATTVILPADDDMIIGARAIVRARVLRVEAASNEQDGRIYTYITLRVRETLKGEIANRRIVIKELGGVLPDRAFTLFGAPRFVPGEEVLLYLDTWADGSLRVYQLFLGKFNIVRDASGREFVERSMPDEQTTVLPATHSHDGAAPATTTNRMELEAYQRMVRDRLAANREASDRFAATYYASVPQLNRPPDYVMALNRQSLQPQFTLLGPARWFEPDSGLPVPFQINPEGAPTSQTIQDVEAAMAAWSNLPGSSLKVVNGGTINFCYVGTGTSAIIFNNCDGRNSPTPGCANVLAWGGLSWFPGQTKIINGTLFRRAVEGFVSFNPYASCHFSNHCNVREIATHELGHALGLGHSQIGDATMAPFAHFDGRCASIREDDLAAILFVYPSDTGGGSGGTPLSISTSSLAPATQGSFYSQGLQAAGGEPPYTWGLAPGSQPLPAGLSISSSGSISGTPFESGTFNFTVRVVDSRQNIATKNLSLTVSAQSTQYDAEFISQSVPESVAPRQQFSVTMSWKNTGTQTWNPSSGFVLRSQNPPGNTTWGGNTVQLSSFSVGPGSTLTVTFTAIAPAVEGTYNFQWQPFRAATGFFGQMSHNVAIRVETPSVEDAAFVAQESPTVVKPGQPAQVQITMRNAGTSTWSPNSHALVPTAQSVTWGVSQVALPGPVGPGQNVTFTFLIFPPVAPGSYGFQWSMAKNGVPFGTATPLSSIHVAGAEDAEFVSQNVPVMMNRGQQAQVSVTMRNIGNKTWTAENGYALATQNPIWGLQRVDLPEPVEPGETVTFTFKVTAPDDAGLYSFQWQMVNGAFFGMPSPNTEVTVTQSSVDDPLTVLTPKKLPQARLDEEYSFQLAATGGAMPYRWELFAGNFPPGFFLDSATGRITGVPSKAKKFKFKVIVTDARGVTTIKKFKLIINR